MTNTKVSWITIWLINLVTSKKVFLLMVFYSRKNNDYVTFYKITFSKKRALELTECIKIDKELHHHNSLITCKALFQRLSNCFITVILPTQWLSFIKKEHAREFSSIVKDLRTLIIILQYLRSYFSTGLRRKQFTQPIS